jgi:2-hydroxy-3-keto-5-methylthiopentenyl-1-phosphate phosphatase
VAVAATVHPTDLPVPTPGRSLALGSIVVDFDGTICEQDISEEIFRAFAPPVWWDIDLEFQRGEIGSRECLIRQASLLRGHREADLLAFVLDRYRLDPTFAPFVRWARDAGADVVVASDGMGFYVEPMLRAAGLEEVRVLTNRTAFPNTEVGPRIEFPFAHPECVGCGTCKMLAVTEERSRWGTVAFVGEGHTDRYGALYADVVFAKKHLPAICLADGIPFFEWDTFDDVRAGLEQLSGFDLEVPIAPAVCPGWTPR